MTTIRFNPDATHDEIEADLNDALEGESVCADGAGEDIKNWLLNDEKVMIFPSWFASEETGAAFLAVGDIDHETDDAMRIAGTDLDDVFNEDIADFQTRYKGWVPKSQILVTVELDA